MTCTVYLCLCTLKKEDRIKNFEKVIISVYIYKG